MVESINELIRIYGVVAKWSAVLIIVVTAITVGVIFYKHRQEKLANENYNIFMNKSISNVIGAMILVGITYSTDVYFNISKNGMIDFTGFALLQIFMLILLCGVIRKRTYS